MGVAASRAPVGAWGSRPPQKFGSRFLIYWATDISNQGNT